MLLTRLESSGLSENNGPKPPTTPATPSEILIATALPILIGIAASRNASNVETIS